jgi:hypothetical protein
MILTKEEVVALAEMLFGELFGKRLKAISDFQA